MPASQPIIFHDGLEARVDPIDERQDSELTLFQRAKNEVEPGKTSGGRRTIYFTDERPRFTVEITNNTEYDFVEGSSVSWYIAIGDGMPEPVYQGKLDIEIPQGESREYEFGGELLAFEGHGVIGLDAGGHSGKGDSVQRKLHAGSGANYSPAYTFSVWDRDHYRVIHERPKEMQRLATMTTLLVAMIGIFQLMFTLPFSPF
ncbi:hypothetical protein B4589_012775 [Halolamina sp. CBA1230]|uniref:hypothetical protein n=1 Tax=Halolamina sp. CBA1230 TaxID=1853690 RepID=UPI00117A70F4|nr:hypothetical protein [Halolamina sp. CBA1230]QKY21205.1 hypothetical protein B4589_012775 [Halolamina sp. CBA1230]